jgi:phosphoribosylformylglycinamidine synthase
MLSQLKELIPGASAWPQFVRNVSEQFEARLSLVKINHSKSIFFKGMEGSILPIAVSHGEGQVVFEDKNQLQQVIDKQLITLQFVDNYEKITEKYPANPNGSPLGITALTNEDGRFTIMMPHAERVFRTSQLSWHPEQWQENSPWFQLFVNARNWLR